MESIFVDKVVRIQVHPFWPKINFGDEVSSFPFPIAFRPMGSRWADELC
jgi:hypothetical protein